MSTAVAQTFCRCLMSSAYDPAILKVSYVVSRCLMWSKDVPKPLADVPIPSAGDSANLHVALPLSKCPVFSRCPVLSAGDPCPL